MFHLVGEGDVFMECKLPMAKNAVFVQSYYLDTLQKQNPGSSGLVHQIYSGYSPLKVFDLRHFSWYVKKQLGGVRAKSEWKQTGNGVPNGGHLAPAISHATAASGFGIDELRKACIIR